MTREPVQPIELGPLRVAVGRRGPSGIVVRIHIADPTGWHEAVKIGAFGRAHWHLYNRYHGEQV